MNLKFDVRNENNLAMLMDFYELTMSNCYFAMHKEETQVAFDLFYRTNPDQGGYVVFAGLEQVIEYIQNLSFSEEDIAYLRSVANFEETFLSYLKNFKFTGTIYAIEEGTPVYPKEPLLRVEGNCIEVQLIETALLVIINHQSLIATKANRIVRSAKGKAVFDFGARRAHNRDAAFYGARASYIGGVNATATVSAGKAFEIPIVGTMAHSFTQFFGPTTQGEYEAFLAYAKTYPDNCSLLIDTYDVLKSGLPNAIRIHHEYLKPRGKRLKGIRIDSGDLAYLSKIIRKTLNENGMEDCQIIVSNSLDEYVIASLIQQGACIDCFGVGERMITSKSSPILGGVYKMVALKEENGWQPRIKISETLEKMTYPGRKCVYRFYSKQTGYAEFDLITLQEERLDTERLPMIDPNKPWKDLMVSLEQYDIVPLLVPIFENGECVYTSPSLTEIRDRSKVLIDTKMWEEEKRFENPNEHYVNISVKLYQLQKSLVEQMRK